jgi:uncharacterized protein (TIGR02300 family)
MIKPMPPTGVKRICPSCAAKFYDLNKQPVVCPKCKEKIADPVAIVS